MPIAPTPEAQSQTRQTILLTKTTEFIKALRREGLLLADAPTFEFRARVHQGDVKKVQTLTQQAAK